MTQLYVDIFNITPSDLLIADTGVHIAHCTRLFIEILSRFNLGSSIASKIKSALFFANCDILGVKIIRIDPLELNLWLYYVYYAVLQLLF